MYGQGSYAPQFRQGHPVHPPQYQQGPPPFQQGTLPPPPPPPPTVNNNQDRPAPVYNNNPIYHHGPPPPPPFQQGGPPPPSQPYLHPPQPGYMNQQQNTQFPAPMPPPRVYPPPPSQGQMLYGAPRPPLPPSIGQGAQHGQLLPPPPPPPPSSFVSVTPGPFVSHPPPPPDHAHPPSMPPPPPPPPPSSPPPLPPSPPPSTPSPVSSPRPSLTSSVIPLNVSSSMSQQDFGSGASIIPDNSESVTDSKGSGPTCSSDGLPASREYSTVDAETGGDMSMLEDKVSSKTKSASDLPPKPAAEDIVRQIEEFCHNIVENGSDFEVITLTKERENPKFTFLFGGGPGSEAAIAHEYFQWMKRKCLEDRKLHNEVEQSGSPARPSEVEDVCYSPADSDMDMEDDMHQFNKDQGVSASANVSKELVPMYKGIVSMKEQQLHNQSSRDDPSTKNASSRIESSYAPPLLVREGREFDHIPFRSLAGASECSLDVITQKSIKPVDDLSPVKASLTLAACISYKEVPNSVSKIGSPFRLIQGYASDDSGEADDTPSFQDVSPVRISPSTIVENKSLCEDEGVKLQMNMGSLSSPTVENDLPSVSNSSLECPTELTSSMLKIPTDSPKAVEATVIPSCPSDAIAKSNELHNDSHDARTSSDIGHQGSLRVYDDVDSQSGKFHERCEKQSSSMPKVDEFGRIIREGISDSDSDVEHYTGKRSRRGRSRSPLDRRRRSRSPRKRNEKRNRSRSWSPRKRRNMSKSRSPPPFRNTGDSFGEKMRRDRDQIPECFDFLKGKCYRGASCRYQHHGSGSDDSARRYRGRQLQHLEVSQDLWKSDVHGDSRSSDEAHEVNLLPSKTDDITIGEDTSNSKKSRSDMAASGIDVPNDRGPDGKAEASSPVDHAMPVTLVEVGQSATSVTGDVGHPDDAPEAIEQGLENQPVQQVFAAPAVCQDNENPTLPQEIDNPLATSQPTTEAETWEISARTLSKETSVAGNAICCPPEEKIPDNEASETNISALPAEKSLPDQNINKSLLIPPESSAPHHPAPIKLHPQISGENYQFQHSQSHLPPPPPPPPPVKQVSQPLREYNLPPSATNDYSQPASLERYPPYQAPMNDQYSQPPPPTKLPWNSLPPPPPPPFVHGSTSSVINHTQSFHPLQFQQNPVPLMRPYQHAHPNHSQASDFHPPSFPPAAELSRPPLRTEGIIQSQPFEYTKVPRDQRFSHSSLLDGNRYHPVPSQVSSMHPPHQFREEHQFPHQAHDASPNFQMVQNQRFTSFMAHENIQTQGISFPNESSAKQLQSFPDGNPHYQPNFGMQWSGTTSFPSHLGSAGPSIRRYPLGFENDIKPSPLSLSGGSRISGHYNPFASTFENIPVSSKYNSTFKQESLKNPISRYDSVGLNQVSPLDSSRSGGQVLPKSGDPYDPLFDSIEPSLKASARFEHLEGGNISGNVISKSVAARSVIDSHTEENGQKAGATAAITTTPENDDLGETAIDTEVGGMESDSPDYPVDIPDKSVGDVETDQVQSKGKNKKSKDSRSMKLFKVALADFVKDVLKPSWRQGNMSKEAFKTIVKKTVDKVAGAMKSHQIPKGQAKINQYVESSQRKLTKLVMGYVDKYVKA